MLYRIIDHSALLLFTAPAYIWYYLYKNKKICPGHLTWIFFGTVSTFFIAPVIRMKQIDSIELIGTDIVTQQILFLFSPSFNPSR